MYWVHWTGTTVQTFSQVRPARPDSFPTAACHFQDNLNSICHLLEWTLERNSVLYKSKRLNNGKWTFLARVHSLRTVRRYFFSRLYYSCSGEFFFCARHQLGGTGCLPSSDAPMMPPPPTLGEPCRALNWSVKRCSRGKIAVCIFLVASQVWFCYIPLSAFRGESAVPVAPSKPVNVPHRCRWAETLESRGRECTSRAQYRATRALRTHALLSSKRRLSLFPAWRTFTFSLVGAHISMRPVNTEHTLASLPSTHFHYTDGNVPPIPHHHRHLLPRYLFTPKPTNDTVCTHCLHSPVSFVAREAKPFHPLPIVLDHKLALSRVQRPCLEYHLKAALSR